MDLKTCKACGIEKPLSEYYLYKPKTYAAYPYSICKACHLEKIKNPGIRDQRAMNRRKHRRTLADWVDEQKRVPCADCNIEYPPYVMDFDHITGDKDKNIAKMIGRCGKARIAEEIAKCEVVCSNCHRQRTHERLQAED